MRSSTSTLGFSLTTLLALAAVQTADAATSTVNTDAGNPLIQAAINQGHTLHTEVGCDAPTAGDLAQSECQAMANEAGVAMHAGNWSWSPTGCLTDLYRNDFFFNTASQGSNVNSNYLSVCETPVEIGPGCSEAFPHGFPSSDDKGLCFSEQGLEVVESYINHHADWTSAAAVVKGFSWAAFISYGYSNQGLVASAKGNPIWGWHNPYGHKQYVTDLELTTGQCSAGFSRVATRDTALNMFREVTGMYWAGTPLNGDLNQDAGGKDIFLCEKIEWAPASAAVTNIFITNHTSKSDCSAYGKQPVHRRDGLNGDTNQSTGGGSRDVFLCLDKDLTDGAPLERVTLVDSSGTCDYAAGEMPAKKSYGSRGDLNAGTGSSKDIFICGDHDEEWQSVIGADTTPSWSGSITQMMLQDTKTCPTGFIAAKTHDGLNGDLNEGAGGEFIYVCYSTEQWRGDPITNFYVDTDRHKNYSGGSRTNDFREVYTVNLDGNLNQGADANGWAKTPSGLYLYYNRFNGDFRYYRTRWFSEFSLMSVRADGFGTRCDNKPGTRNNWKANDDGIHNNIYVSHKGLQTAGGSQIDLNYDVSGSKDVYPCGIYHDVN